ncbi:MAG: 7-cyano-7-deazaguanine synthase QueC [Candidatus Competibacteraceae bacterium]|nr:7-cyano-7-deazaguanine synthase QueC [Candidatus Competibacteraceae bacterium]
MAQALVVLSGGQDSTTCLYWAIARFGSAQIDTLTFDYGQRHRIELDCARQVADLAGVPNTVLPINTFAALAGNALTDPAVMVKSEPDPATQLPNTFVPGRNLIFLTFAAAYAYQKNIHHLIAGMAQTDYSGYPDCREATLKTLEQAIRLGMEFELTLHTPLMFKSKRETVELAQSVGALAALAYSHTCYEGYQPPCGQCAACVLRAKGFAEAGLPDPLLARFNG